MREGLFQAAVTWSTFISVTTAVAVVYVLLVLLRRRLDRGLYLREADGPVRAFLRIFLLLIDPLAVAVLMAVFVAIWPTLHGLILLLILAFGYPWIRDFVAGRVLQFDRGVKVGRQLETQGLHGTVAALGLTALYMQREEGRSRLSYLDVLRSGYTISGDPTRGGYFQLQVVLPEGKDTDDHSHGSTAIKELHNLLLDNPYVRPSFRLQLHPGDTGERVVDLNVGVLRAEHLQHLVAQLREQGFVASIISR